MTKKLKKRLIRIIIALVLFVIVFIFDKIFNLATIINNDYGWFLPFGLYFVIYIFIGHDVIKKAFGNIIHGQILDENFLMCLATFGAFGLAIFRGINKQHIEGFDEACAVLLFYQIGEFFQAYATGKSRKSIASLMDIRPDFANVYIEDEVQTVDPTEVKVGDIILVKPGEKIPLDGTIVKGATTVDARALTGESVPLDLNEGMQVISGCVNISSSIEIRVDKIFYDSTVSKILDLVENASSKKSKAEKFITKFAKYYTPIVVIIALLLVLIPSLITRDFSTWLYRGLSFLVVSCPCALVISIPLSFFAGIGAASKHHILVKGSSYLEKFNKSNIFVFDKTGTLTKGNFVVTEVVPKEKEDMIIKLAAIAEKKSNHPIAKSILNYYQKNIIEDYEIEEILGYGLVAKKDDDIIYCGNEKLMQKFNIKYNQHDSVGTIVYVAKNQEFIGYIIISDEIKTEAVDVINKLNTFGQTIMLTGDNYKIASKVYEQLHLKGYKASLLPQNKVTELENIIASKNKNDVVCYIGDGINDAPVLMMADVGISMGQVGSDAAIEASDIVLMKDDLNSLVTAKKIAQKTIRIVFENIIFSIFIKVLILLLSAFGYANMWMAIFGDVGVAVIAILNAIRVNSKY